MIRDTMDEDIDNAAEDADFMGDGDSSNKGMGFDLQQQGHISLQIGRIGQWAAGLWFASRGITTTFGAEGSKHDLFVENLDGCIQSVQVKATTLQYRCSSDLMAGRTRYQWRLKASPGQMKSGRGSWDAGKSDRLILVALNGERAMLWLFDSELHHLEGWKTQMGIRMMKTDVEAETPFLTIAPTILSMPRHDNLKMPVESTLFDFVP